MSSGERSKTKGDIFDLKCCLGLQYRYSGYTFLVYKKVRPETDPFPQQTALTAKIGAAIQTGMGMRLRKGGSQKEHSLKQQGKPR